MLSVKLGQSVKGRVWKKLCSKQPLYFKRCPYLTPEPTSIVLRQNIYIMQSISRRNPDFEVTLLEGTHSPGFDK